MSEQLKFSEELIESLQERICQHDEQAQDPGVFMQYLAIAMGYTLSQLNMEQQTQQEFLQQLYGFTQHVMEDMSQRNVPEPSEEAFGVWHPGD